jgi:hypothetical protein
VEVLRSALRHAVEPEDIEHVVRNALVVEEIAEDPVRYLLLGADRAGRFLELVVMDRPAGTGCDPCNADASEVPNSASEGAMMSTTHGRTADGTPITDEMVEVIADEAERGYDVEPILRARRGGRPSMGTAASSVESVRLDPELKRDLLLRAAEEHISVSEAIRRAISRYLHAS